MHEESVISKLEELINYLNNKYDMADLMHLYIDILQRNIIWYFFPNIQL
jgi:hypothetical protein